ncbi:IS607 family transposase [Brasilonema octagenarum UFV-E1]|jgi:predicted site-specific integrase-resolvase|uniref:IS607 family transposase n=1 Tax=Brasilonema sennae CENA114 TaxID=415709 RepID=A0A856M6F1_9CYAN|nr:IS607 family transposase [Brasilonema sennae]QDL06735.1 IS607 family transposase [Brasilonema sennae CENA114]QDL13104.1 IS607 family transposase [Brasilonema octagenarum UFV-E1]
MFKTPKETSSHFGVCLHTLRRWEKTGIIKAIRTPSGQRRYDITSYTGISANRGNGATITYARVSSRGQKADLDRQVAVLKNLYPDSELITDIASGLNFKRPGLKTLLGRVREGNVGLVVVAHKDRLARFGFDLIQWLLQQDNTRLVVLNQDNLSPEREMVEDILAIVHVFSCRLYGLRKYKTTIKEDKDLPRA